MPLFSPMHCAHYVEDIQQAYRPLTACDDVVGPGKLENFPQSWRHYLPKSHLIGTFTGQIDLPTNGLLLLPGGLLHALSP